MGNVRFVSSVNQEPILAEAGEKGEDYSLFLELKLLADVGIIGKPNAGKSTLLAMCSQAKPKIAAYPFTTIDPVLGVVATRDESFVMMEVPGLIEGAHKGSGLGHEFLRHTQRSRLLLHMLDGLSQDTVGDLHSINSELAMFDPSLGEKSQFTVVNKIDIPEVKARLPLLKCQLASPGKPLFFISAATGEGVTHLMGKTLEALHSFPQETPKPALAEPPIIRPKVEEPFTVTWENGVYVVYAPRLARLVPLANLKDLRAMVQLWKEMERMGVVKALEEKGVNPGDTFRLGGVELEWY